jgi:hypothetical protein
LHGTQPSHAQCHATLFNTLGDGCGYDENSLMLGIVTCSSLSQEAAKDNPAKSAVRKYRMLLIRELLAHISIGLEADLSDTNGLFLLFKT